MKRQWHRVGDKRRQEGGSETTIHKGSCKERQKVSLKSIVFVRLGAGPMAESIDWRFE